MIPTREAIVEEALSWLGTPFHDHAGVKGAGCDCAHHIKNVFVAVGFIEDFEVSYKPQWFLHKREPLFLKALEQHGARRIDPAAALPGDVLMYCYGNHAAHGAIVVDGNTVVHAFRPVGTVTRGDRRELLPKLDSAWTIFP